MAEGNAQLQWSEDQWTRVRQVVYEEARRARVAGSFLPLFGPLDADARYATKELLYAPHDPRRPDADVEGFTIGDSETLKLSTLQAKVYLRGAQVADPDLTGALIAFRRAANVISRLEDGIVFLGQTDSNKGPPDFSGPWQVVGGEPTDGLLKIANEGPGPSDPGERGDFLVAAVSAAIGELEARYHLGPFACVLDQDYFNIAQTPTRHSRVLPQHRILPFLGGGALLRSSVLDDGRARVCEEGNPEGYRGTGLVVALGGAPIDLVVASDISVQFLQVTTEPWFVFRVHEKIVLRINQPDAVVYLPPAPPPPSKANGGA